MAYIPSNLLAKTKNRDVQIVSGNEFKADFDKRLHGLLRLSVDEIKTRYRTGYYVATGTFMCL